MNYCLMIFNGYIEGFCQSENTVINPILEEAFNRIKAAHSNRPSAPDGFAYKLRADTLEWELVELPPIEIDDEATESDYIEALNDWGVDVN